MNAYHKIVTIVRAKLAEEMPANVAGAGHVAGIGVGPQGEPPGPTALLDKLRMLKRKKPNVSVAN